MINKDLFFKYSKLNKKKISIEEGLRKLFDKYYSLKYETIIDTAAVASTLSFEILSNKVDPLLEKAFSMTNPNFDIENYNSLNPNQLTPILGKAKGKYFELLIEKKLNDGEMIGNISLPYGAKAKLAESMTQEGWDLNIINESGEILDYYQIKATDSLGYIKSALERYPDIKIISTNDIISDNDLIINSDIENESLNEEIENLFSSKTSSFSENIINGFNPILPLLFIAISQGFKIVIKKDKKERIIKDTFTRSERTLILSAYSSLYYASGLGWLSIPFIFGTGIIFDSLKRINSIIRTFDKIISELYNLEYSQKARVV